MPNTEKRLMILIPSFNEEKNLPHVLDKLLVEKTGLEKNGWHIDILIINDGSVDNTEKIARQKGAQVVTLPINLGYGAALQTGFKVARELNYDAVFCMDADGQHRPEDLQTMMNVFIREPFQVILGSRFITNTGYKSNLFRKMGITLFSFVLKLLCGKKIADVTTGLQLLDKRVYYLLAEEYPHDFPDTQVLLLLSLVGYEIKEVPVTVKQRVFGKSMHSSIISIFYPLRNSLAIIITLLRIAQIRRDYKKMGD